MRRAEAVYVRLPEEDAGNVEEGSEDRKEPIWANVEREKMSEPESYASVWDAIADSPEQAANLRARAESMQKIAARLKEHGWTQYEAASRCGVTQPRINLKTAVGAAFEVRTQAGRYRLLTRADL
jgi:predicted XRE-type DNA-binding protein